MEKDELIWKELSHDDFIYKKNGYVLRVEQMDKKYWWWSVFYKHEQLGFDDPLCRTENEAKLICEALYLRHLINNKEMKIIDKIKNCQTEQELDILIRGNIKQLYGNPNYCKATFEQRNIIINSKKTDYNSKKFKRRLKKVKEEIEKNKNTPNIDTSKLHKSFDI